jgi:hypothetical protein
MPERRTLDRPDAPDRRTLPRPPMWLNLLLLVLGALLAIAATTHHGRLEKRFANLMAREESSPTELKRLRDELAAMDLTRDQLKKELDNRATFLKTLQSDQFYISIDTTKKRFTFNLGNETLRDAPVEIGPPATLEGGGKSWTFVPLKGEVEIVDKREGGSWQVAPWVYLLNKQPIPADPPAIPNGMGRYVLDLPNGYVIHSQPSPDSPLKGARPGSFLVPEEDLRAIWPRLQRGVRVYVF